MTALLRHWPRIAITLLPVLAALLHAAGVWRQPLIDRLDHILYDTRLEATMPRTRDARIVIVDIDDASLQEIGQWPWSRDKLAHLVTEIMSRQRATVLGFDVVFAEVDRNTGRVPLDEVAHGPWRADPAFEAEMKRLAATLDHDAAFARALEDQRVVLGYYFTDAPEPRAKGHLPAPVLPLAAFPEGRDYTAHWNSFGASIPPLARAAPAGFLNVLIDAGDDGIVRSAPLLGRYDGPAAEPGYYESLGLAVYRLATGAPQPALRFVGDGRGGAPLLESVVLGQEGAQRLAVPVDRRAGFLVPFRGAGGAQGGSFRYVPAMDVLEGRLAPGELAGKIVLVGASAPGLQDLRATPVSATYPGVEVHANVVSGLLDRRLYVVPDYAPGYDVVVLFVAGVALAVGLSLLPALRAVLLTIGTAALVTGLNHLLYLRAGLVLPLAAALLMIALAFAFNMSWGYFVEARARRGLAQLFGTYVPPELVDEMLDSPGRYSMRAESKELTVMFCDMRDFTRFSERMPPARLQAFLNHVFSRLTEVISRHRGTVDKYMGDCVMAFWGAPVDAPDHADLAVAAALDMAATVQDINRQHRAAGLPEISIGIGLNSGVMSVGDMGSAVRRSYTVIGDAVNLAARLEGLASQYGVEIVAGEATRKLANAHLWQELDEVTVKGRVQTVAIFTPRGRIDQADAALRAELAQWSRVRDACRARQWQEAERLLTPLLAGDEKKVLYRRCSERLASSRLLPPDTDTAWTGAVRFETTK